MKVKNIINQNGRAVPNQFVITDENKTVFQSYNSVIAIVDYENSTITFGADWDCSNTTNRHRNTFFTDYCYFADLQSATNIRKAIKNGTISTHGVEWTVKFNSDLC